MAEQNIASLHMMGWGLMLAENSSAAAVAVAVPRECPRGGPLDFREIIFFSEHFQKSMILLVYTGKKSKKSKI